MKTTEARKQQLIDRRAELVARSENVVQELESHDEKDWEDLATERETDEVLEGIGLSALTEIRKIDAALQRIEAGEYGDCAKCGDRISEERLEVVPFTPFCRKCAA